MIALAAGASLLGDGINTSRLLDCIRQVEGHRWTDPGGAYCIQPGTWRQHTRLPYSYAQSKPHADDVGERHLLWLARLLRADGYPVTTYTLATSWNIGFDGFQKRRAVSSYGERVSNLYHEK